MNKIAVLILAFALAGCATVDGIATVVTTTITNPITQVDIYRVKNTYAAANQLVVDYRVYCWGRPYAELMADPLATPVCKNRRPIVRAAQSYRAKAELAISQADAFIQNNPTLNAATLVNAAWAAVTAYQNSIPKIN